MIVEDKPRKNYEERLQEYETDIKKWNELHRNKKRLTLPIFHKPHKPKKYAYSEEGKIRMLAENNPAKRPEVREKISEANRRRKLSPETRQKISEAKSGEKHPMWQGGISFEPYGIEFNDILKAQIRKRDNYICTICLKRQGRTRFAVHHIDYDKKNNDPKNLITVCRRCHGLTVKNKERWIRFFSKRRPAFWAISKQRPLQVVDFISLA